MVRLPAKSYINSTTKWANLNFLDVRGGYVTGLPGAAARSEPPMFVAAFQDQKAFSSPEVERVGLRRPKGIKRLVHSG